MIIRARGHLHWHCGNLYQRQLYPRLGAGCTELRPHEGFGDDKEVLLQDTRGVSPKARVMWYHLTWLNCLEKVENQSHSGVQHFDSTILSTQLFRHYKGTTEASPLGKGPTGLRLSDTSRGLRLLAYQQRSERFLWLRILRCDQLLFSLPPPLPGNNWQVCREPWAGPLWSQSETHRDELEAVVGFKG